MNEWGQVPEHRALLFRSADRPDPDYPLLLELLAEVPELRFQSSSWRLDHPENCWNWRCESLGSRGGDYDDLPF